MQQLIRFCFYNTDDATGEQIRRPVGTIPYLNIMCESSQLDDVRQAVSSGQVDMMLVNLDPDLDSALQMVQMVVRLAPEMGIVGVSQQTDPHSIISAMRAGCSQFVCSPIDPEDLEQAVHRIQSTRANVIQDSRRICVVGSTGGVGSSMVACNLALELGYVTERPTALLDLDLEFGDVAASFDCRPEFSVADLCMEGAELDATVIESAMHQLPCNVHLLPRPEDIEQAHQIAPELVAQTLDLLGGIYANVVLDLPRSYNFFSSAAVERADLLLIVAQLSVPSIRNAQRIYDLLMRMGAKEDSVELVLNRFKADHERISTKDVEQQFSRPVYAKIPNDYRSVAASLDLGYPIQAESPDSPARVAINELARKIATVDQQPSASAERRGLFKRLLG